MRAVRFQTKTTVGSNMNGLENSVFIYPRICLVYKLKFCWELVYIRQSTEDYDHMLEHILLQAEICDSFGLASWEVGCTLTV